MIDRESRLKTLAMVKSAALERLSAVGDSAVLEVELIITRACQLPRSACYAFPEKVLSDVEYQQVMGWVSRRAQGEPLAYILGEKEFWSLTLEVNAATLIPRPETECLVEWVLSQYPVDTTLRVADLGTGSGAIAIALAKERPHWKIDATDQSAEALRVAKRNIQRHACQHITCYQGHWCDALPQGGYDLMVSNPPYIEVSDPHLQDLQYEPQSALVASQAGLSDLDIIIQQALSYLVPGGRCVVEHGASQASAVIHQMKRSQYAIITGYPDWSGHDRFVVGRRRSS